MFVHILYVSSQANEINQILFWSDVAEINDVSKIHRIFYLYKILETQ